MEPGRPSRTARQNALFRALDSRHSAQRQIAGDHLAAAFLSPEFKILTGLARLPGLGTGIEAFIDHRWPCARGGVVARTRLLDEAITEVLPGVDQVVILGAGFDSRAYRLAGMEAVRVFEVDHPLTQAAKKQALERHDKHLGDRAVFVPVVFGRDDSGAALATAGFETGRKTLVLWEGVTNYLDAESVDATFRFVAGAVAAGSPVLFTYIHKGMLDGSEVFEGAKTTMKAVGGVGEPFSFGFYPKDLPAYLEERGFEVCWDKSVAEAGAGFYAAVGVRAPSLPAYYHVAKATRA